MRAFIYMFMSLAAVAMLSTACAPKDKRFKSKISINKDGGKKEDDSGKKPTDTEQPPQTPSTSDEMKQKTRAMNPSGVEQTEIVIELDELKPGSLGDFDRDLDLTVKVNLLIEIKSSDAVDSMIPAEVGSLELVKVSEKEEKV